jgi:hypothetical protein
VIHETKNKNSHTPKSNKNKKKWQTLKRENLTFDLSVVNDGDLGFYGGVSD